MEIYKLSLKRSFLLCGILLLPVLTRAQDTPNPENGPKPDPTLNVSLTAGYSDMFQLILGGRFGAGPDFQNQLNVGVNDAFATGDSVSMFGWSTTDLASGAPNWQAGLLYKAPLLRRKNHHLLLTFGGQRWVLPLVGSGAKDWMVTGNLTYGTTIKRVPIFFSEDSFSLLRSTLPTGSATYSQIYTEHRLLRREAFQLSLRQGPAYAYSWGFYGINGSQVLRYGGSLTARWSGNAVEAGYWKQFGLQDGVRNYGFWSISVTRQLTKALF